MLSTELSDEEIEEFYIENYILEKLTNQELSIQINFKKPSIIASSRKEPDQLFIKFLMGHIFIDEADF